MTREVMQMVLNELERFGRGEGGGLPLTVLVEALREAIAQPAQPNPEIYVPDTMDFACVAQTVQPATATATATATVTVEMSRIAQYKLDELTKQGFVVNGYAIERRDGDLVNRGFITDGGMVCWWHDDEPTGAIEAAHGIGEKT